MALSVVSEGFAALPLWVLESVPSVETAVWVAPTLVLAGSAALPPLVLESVLLAETAA